ncbi:MAG: GGDEF domain-containing protein [Candidatus Omnitrophica bacterium]|nr:GGDEF domain-containing protein [Candidatus Omnitrophota bacterium]
MIWLALALGASLALLWIRGRRFQAGLLGVRARRDRLGERLARLRGELESRRSMIQLKEEAIQGISDLYGLSKRLLATLDLKEALRVTEETLMKWIPHADPQERARILSAVRSAVERGEVPGLELLSAAPAAGAEIHSKDRWEILSGQLALGFRRISLYRQVQESALHDGLTGLLVRRHFLERLEEEVARALRRGSWLAFLMVDLDYFKRINDTYGHLVGDVVLREVASLIQRSVREVDLVGRYGGEEFAVVLPEAGRALGAQIAGRIRQGIEQSPLKVYDERISITVSIGIAFCPEDARTAGQLIEQADRAMYQAKSKGRNQVVAAK